MEGGSLSDWLSGLSIVSIGVGTFAVMLVAAAAGDFIRKMQLRRSAKKERETEPSVAQEGYLLGSVLGLLGLLLAFTFGMALNRYEQRRELVMQEANAIGTAYLRSQLLDEPYRGRLSRILLEYTENRIALATVGGTDRLTRNDRLVTDMWAAVRASRESALSHGLTTALLVTFNEVIDLDGERKVAWELRIPGEVLAMLTVYLAVIAAVVGHQVDGPRGRRAALLLFAMVAFSIAVIADINRPMSGHARESQKPMEMLLASLRAQPPAVFDQFNPQSAPTAQRQ
jgi:putative effector of murein hydrolase LrgA (UPF0299 family)